jgi:endonuclease III
MSMALVFDLLEEKHQLTMLEQMKEKNTPFQMLIATLLSARSKDSTVIPIVNEMFKSYPGPEDYVNINLDELEKIIFKIGFYKTKAKHIKELSKILIEKFDSNVPNTFDELTSLPGVGRKTANCILSYCFGIPTIAVDIHVHRISNRLGWVKTITPEQTEEALKKLVPKKLWIKVNSMLVGHGQSICKPIGPMCGECNIRGYCEFGKEK